MNESESEKYEDANSKFIDSKNNTFSQYQEGQSRMNNSPRGALQSKGNESSIYQDAKSKMSNNSGYNKANNIIQEKNANQLKKEFLQKIDMQNEEEINTNKKLNNLNNGIKIEKANNNDSSGENNNEDKQNESQSVYSEPEEGNIVKEMTLFEGASNKGGCCNLPKCFIF